MARVYYDTMGQVVELIDNDVEIHVPREPTWRMIIIDRASWLIMARNGFDNHFVQASEQPSVATASKTSTGHEIIAKATAYDGSHVVLCRKERVTLTADRLEIATVDEDNGDPGDIAMISHNAPDPVKLWAGVGTLDPIPGPIVGLCRDPQPIRGFITGSLMIALTHPQYFADPIYVLVSPRKTDQEGRQNG